MNAKTKPHRYASSVGVAYTPDDSATDRRLSDLLPADIIKQIGFVPDQVAFHSQNNVIRRRATDPGLLFGDIVDQSAKILDSLYTQGQNLQPHPDFVEMDPRVAQAQYSFFLIDLADSTVDGYCSKSTAPRLNSGVVILDEPFMRYGRIVKQISLEDCKGSAIRIISTDENGYLGDYLMGQNSIAEALFPTLLSSCGVDTKILSIETVSYQSRALIRVKVTRANVPNIERFYGKVIALFCTSVEVYE